MPTVPVPYFTWLASPMVLLAMILDWALVVKHKSYAVTMKIGFIFSVSCVSKFKFKFKTELEFVGLNTYKVL